MNKPIKTPRVVSFFNLLKKIELKIGDRIKLSGGYDASPAWLTGKKAYYGEVVGFINGPYKQNDAIVKLDEEISFSGNKGNFLILTLRFKWAIWGKKGIVHLHLFNSIPRDEQWYNVTKEKWDETHIESHATYRII